MAEFPIDFAIILGLSNLFVIPLFVFFIKLIIKVGNMESALKNIEVHVSGAQAETKELNEAKTKLQLLEQRVNVLEKNMEFLLSTKRRLDLREKIDHEDDLRRGEQEYEGRNR